MNKEITKYYFSAVRSSKHPVLSFKDDDFVAVAYEDFYKNEYGNIDETHPMCKLLSEHDFKHLFQPFTDKEKQNGITTKDISIPCAVAYKTLKTSFYKQEKLKKYISELTGVYYLIYGLYAMMMR